MMADRAGLGRTSQPRPACRLMLEVGCAGADGKSWASLTRQGIQAV